MEHISRLGFLEKEESIMDFAAYADDLCILISESSCRGIEIKTNKAVYRAFIIGIKDSR